MSHNSQVHPSVDEADRRYVWHPCTQMKDHDIAPPLDVVRADGPFIFTRDGKRIIDGISSWWVNLLGHNHPRLTAALCAQAARFPHVMFAGFTHEPAVRLAAELCRIAPGGGAKVFYADCGSAAVEVALKMSFQFWQQTGKPTKRQFVSLGGAYHGETLGALSLSGLPLYREVFAPLMLDTVAVRGPECVRCPHGLDRATCQAECFGHMARALDDHASSLAAVFIEPMVQCANGMNMYSPVYLRKLRAACTAHDVHLVADEIAVGFGRTGRMFACEHAGIAPDFTCVSKGLTGGYLPFAAVVVRDQQVFDAFLGEHHEHKAFLHSHSYTGNPLACSVALEALAVLETEALPALPDRITLLGRILERLGSLPHVDAVRQCGFIGAVDLVEDRATRTAYDSRKRMGWHVYRRALDRGALLRPLGDTVYFMTPLTIPTPVLEELGEIAYNSIQDVTEP